MSLNSVPDVKMWVLLLLLSHAVLRGFTQKPPQPDFLPLDMALDAVDDMYSGCNDMMDSKVKKEYLPNEKNTAASNFTLAWREAEKYYNKIWKRKRSKRPSASLGKEQIMSIYAYSLDKPNVYAEFNNAVRTQRTKYKSAFHFHSLHFFLTDAIQKINARKGKSERCVTVYRRVNGYFRRDVLNKLVRFGSFTSTSMGWYPSASRFGDRSCFEIDTCFGADISLYSKLGEAEREVLVPPYEIFKIAKMKKRTEFKSLPCEVLYVLRSMGVASNLNCALF